MGLLFTKFIFDLKEHHKILMIGLDGVGKTTLLYKLKVGEVGSTIPTIGFSVESIIYRNLNFTVWDVGGQDKIRYLWRHYFENSAAVIFVIDATDHERLPEVQDEIKRLTLELSLLNTDILILLNKQDQPNAMTPSYIIDKLKLNNIKDRKWFVQPTVALSGQGVYEGLDWLEQTLKHKN